MPIPHIIHQVWFQFPGGSATPPSEYTAMRESWRAHHPTWEFRLWDSAAARALLQEHYPAVLPVYDGYTQEIMRVDAIRYFLLHHFGGFYVDMDTECTRPLDDLCAEEIVLVKDATPFFILNNGFMGARAGHPFMAKCGRHLRKSARAPNAIVATGPLYLATNWLTTPGHRRMRVLGLRELKQYFTHHHHASWTFAAQWGRALNKERRGYMRLADVPWPLRPWLKGKVGHLLSPAAGEKTAAEECKQDPLLAATENPFE